MDVHGYLVQENIKTAFDMQHAQTSNKSFTSLFIPEFSYTLSHGGSDCGIISLGKM